MADLLQALKRGPRPGGKPDPQINKIREVLEYANKMYPEVYAEPEIVTMARGLLARGNRGVAGITTSGMPNVLRNNLLRQGRPLEKFKDRILMSSGAFDSIPHEAAHAYARILRDEGVKFPEYRRNRRHEAYRNQPGWKRRGPTDEEEFIRALEALRNTDYEGSAYWFKEERGMNREEFDKLMRDPEYLKGVLRISKKYNEHNAKTGRPVAPIHYGNLE